MQDANGPARRTAPGTAAGVLDTIADGMSLVLERPRLMALPLVLDLVLWLGLQVTAMPLISSVADFFERSGGSDGETVADELRPIGEDLMATDALGTFLPSIFSGIPVDSVFHQLVMTLAPASAWGVSRDAFANGWGDGLTGMLMPDSGWTTLIIGLACALVGSLLLAAYRVPMARAVRGETRSRILPEIGKGWLHILAYVLLLVMASVAALIPLFIASMVFLLLGLNLVFVVTMALLIFGGMASVYTLFVVDAMLLHRTGPIGAFRMSMAVGRRHFAQVARFALISLLLLLGALHLWSRLVDSVPGVAFALVANAFLGTGLATASMLFYADRFRILNARQRATRRQQPRA